MKPIAALLLSLCAACVSHEVETEESLVPDAALATDGEPELAAAAPPRCPEYDECIYGMTLYCPDEDTVIDPLSPMVSCQMETYTRPNGTTCSRTEIDVSACVPDPEVEEEEIYRESRAAVRARNPWNTIYEVKRGSDGAVWYRTASSAGVAGWSSIGGVIKGRPSIAVNADGRMEVFVRGTDNALWHNWQTWGGWSGWHSLGGYILNSPRAIANQDGRLEVFALGADRGLYQKWQVCAGCAWSGWNPMGGWYLGHVSVRRNADGRLEVFGRGGGGTPHQSWQQWAGGPWVRNVYMGGNVDTISSYTAAGRLGLLSRAGGTYWSNFQQCPGCGWTGWRFVQ